MGKAATLGWMVFILLVTTARPSVADIYIKPESVTSYAEILEPADGEIFVVRSPSETVSVTAIGSTGIEYCAGPTLDLYPYTGEATGGTLTHRCFFWFDGTLLYDQEVKVVPDAPEGQDEGACATYRAIWDDSDLTLTKDCGVGWHSVVLVHYVVDDRTEIHLFKHDWITFQVILIPEPATAFLLGAGLLGIAAWRRGRSRG